MGPMLILSEDEEQAVVKWITDCSHKGYALRELGIQLSVTEFLIVNKRKTLFIENMPVNGWLQASFTVILSCPPALVKV